jgi:hypothetical protein
VPTFRVSVWGISEPNLPSSWQAADAPALLAGLRVALTELSADAARLARPCTLEVRTGAGWEPVGWFETWASVEFLEDRAPTWWGRALQLGVKED